MIQSSHRFELLFVTKFVFNPVWPSELHQRSAFDGSGSLRSPLQAISQTGFTQIWLLRCNMFPIAISFGGALFSTCGAVALKPEMIAIRPLEASELGVDRRGRIIPPVREQVRIYGTSCRISQGITLPVFHVHCHTVTGPYAELP